MEKQVTHIAYNNDLYEIVFLLDRHGYHIERVMLYPDNNGQAGVELDYWKLPTHLKQRINDRISDYIE